MKIHVMGKTVVVALIAGVTFLVFAHFCTYQNVREVW